MAQDLSKRGKVGDVYRGGTYKKTKFKTAGLSSNQMKKATTLKGKKVSASQMKKAGELKPISSTKWVEGKGVVGPGGKAFTGTVQLASGKTASYVKGRRIGVASTKPSKPAGNGRSGQTPNPPPGGNKNNARLKKQGVRTSKLQDRTAARRGGTKPRTMTTTTKRTPPRSKKTTADIWSDKFGWYRGKVD